MRKAYRNITIALISAPLVFALTGCGAGPNAEARLIKQVTDGVEKSVTTNGSDLKIVNFLLVATEDGSAVVVGSLFNYSDQGDEILGMSVGQSQASITGLTTLEAGKPVIFEGESATSKAVFSGVNAKPGVRVIVTIGFARAGLVTKDVIIRDKRDDFAGVTN